MKGQVDSAKGGVNIELRLPAKPRPALFSS
jgi:hypothetical protein